MTSTGSLVCYIVGTVLICAYGVGIVLIIIGILLPHAYKFFCGGCWSEVPLESPKCPYCGKDFGLVEAVSMSRLNKIRQGGRDWSVGQSDSNSTWQLLLSVMKGFGKHAILGVVACGLLMGILWSISAKQQSQADQPQPITQTITTTEYETICKATISMLFKQPTRRISVHARDGDVVYLSYMRDADGTVWRYGCRIQGHSVIWKGDNERWRTDPRDERITYSVDQNRRKVFIRETYADKTYTEEEYPL